MNEIKFSCKDCVFSENILVNGKSVQYGCMLNRSQKLNPEEKFESDENSSYYVFNRFCNTRRPKEWLEEYYSGNMDSAVIGVMSEVRPRLSIIIDFNYDMDLLKENFSIIENQMESRKFVIVINDKIEYNMEIFTTLDTLYQKGKIAQYHILMPVADTPTYDSIDDSIKFCKNGWIVFLDKGDKLPADLTEVIDNRINSEMKRFVYCKKENKTFIIQAAIFKLLGGNSPKIMSDGSINNDDFITRVNNLQYKDNDCVVEWSDLFNA